MMFDSSTNFQNTLAVIGSGVLADTLKRAPSNRVSQKVGNAYDHLALGRAFDMCRF